MSSCPRAVINFQCGSNLVNGWPKMDVVLLESGLGSKIHFRRIVHATFAAIPLCRVFPHDRNRGAVKRLILLTGAWLNCIAIVNLCDVYRYRYFTLYYSSILYNKTCKIFYVFRFLSNLIIPYTQILTLKQEAVNVLLKYNKKYTHILDIIISIHSL